jgi:hypothetical protein
MKLKSAADYKKKFQNILCRVKQNYSFGRISFRLETKITLYIFIFLLRSLRSSVFLREPPQEWKGGVLDQKGNLFHKSIIKQKIY